MTLWSALTCQRFGKRRRSNPGSNPGVRLAIFAILPERVMNLCSRENRKPDPRIQQDPEHGEAGMILWSALTCQRSARFS